MNFSVDASIAVNVFHRNVIWVDSTPLMSVGGDFVPVPQYSKDLTQAMMVVEAMRNRGYPYIFSNGSTYKVAFMAGPQFNCEHESQSRAICLGALKVLGFGLTNAVEDF